MAEQKRLKELMLYLLREYGPQTTKELHARMGGDKPKRLLGYLAKALVRDGLLQAFSFQKKYNADGSLLRVWALQESVQPTPPPDPVADPPEDDEDEPETAHRDSLHGVTVADLEWMRLYSLPRVERLKLRMLKDGGCRT